MISFAGYSISWMDVFVLLCTLGYGGYALCAGLRMAKAGRLFPGALLLPRECTPETCASPEAYARFLRPRLLAAGIGLTVLGMFNFVWPVLVAEGSVPRVLGLAGYVPMLACLVWLDWMLRRARRDFWP